MLWCVCASDSQDRCVAFGMTDLPFINELKSNLLKALYLDIIYYTFDITEND